MVNGKWQMENGNEEKKRISIITYRRK